MDKECALILTTWIYPKHRETACEQKNRMLFTRGWTDDIRKLSGIKMKVLLRPETLVKFFIWRKPEVKAKLTISIAELKPMKSFRARERKKAGSWITALQSTSQVRGDVELGCALQEYGLPLIHRNPFSTEKNKENYGSLKRKIIQSKTSTVELLTICHTTQT